MINCTEKDGAAIFNMRVVPHASRSEIVGEHDGDLKVRIASPPFDGAANAELIRLLAKTFGVPKAAVEIVSGQTSRTKQIRITGVTAAQMQSVLGG